MVVVAGRHGPSEYSDSWADRSLARAGLGRMTDGGKQRTRSCDLVPYGTTKIHMRFLQPYTPSQLPPALV